MGPPLLRRPAPDQGTEALCERVMKGYFKTHCDQAYGGRRRCCERSVHGPDAGQARCRTGFFPFLGGRPPQGRPAQDLARGAQKKYIRIYIIISYTHKVYIYTYNYIACLARRLLAGWLAGWLAGCWLAGCLAGWMDGCMDGLDGWVGWSRSKGQAVTLARAMPLPAASAPVSVGASTPGSATVASVSASTPGTAPAVVSASTPGQATPALNQCPDDWARRHRKRTEAIAAIKRTHEYQEFCRCSQEYQDSCRHRLRLFEPDPADRSMSKRAWEKAVRTWRVDLRLAHWISHEV